MPDSKDYEELGYLARNLSAWASQRGITMKELSQSTGVPYSMLRDAGEGKIPARITLRHMEALSCFFGTTIHDLLTKN